MKKFLKYIALLLASFISVATLISLISFYSLRNSSLYKPSFLVNSVPETNFDYVVLGSSVGLTTLNTKLIDSLTGLKGINMSEDDTGLSSQYLMLEHLLNEGKKMNYCILAPGLPALSDVNNTFGGNDYRFLPFINRDYVSEYFKESADINVEARYGLATKFLPFVGIAYYNTELFFPSIRVLFDRKKRNRFDDKGNYTYPVLQTGLKERSVTSKTINFDHQYLERIEVLCKKNNIQLIYYIAPEYAREVIIPENLSFSVINHVGIFNQEPTLFYDNLHVNHVGRKKATERFTQDFVQLENLKPN